MSIIKTLLKHNRGGQHYEFSHLLSLSFSLRVSIHSQSMTWASEGVSGQPVQTFCVGKQKAQIPAQEQEFSLPLLMEESILSWPGINNMHCILLL